MINSCDISLIHSGDEDIKRMIKDVVSDYKVFLSIPKDFIVHISNDFDEIMEKKYGESEPSNQPRTRKIEVHYEENNEDFQDNSVMNKAEEEYCVFKDTESNVKLAPVIKSFKYTLTVEITAKSKSILNAAIGKIRSRDAVIRKNFRHNNISTSCYIDNRAVILLNEINEKRKTLYPNEKVSDYIKKYRNDTLVTTNSSGADNAKNILGIKTNFSNIYSMLTTEANGLKAEYNSDNKNYNLTLNFDLYLNLPIALNASYPSVIFNKPLNKLFVQSIDPYELHIGEPRYIDEFDKISRVHPEIYTDRTINYVSIPLWDTHILPEVGSSYRRIFSALLDATGHNPLVSVMNLEHMSTKVKIKDEFIAFFKNGEYQYILSLFKSVFLLNVFEDDKIISNSYITIDSDLNIFVSKQMDIKKLYRVSLSICLSPNLLTLEAYKRAMLADMFSKLNNILVINGIFNFELYDLNIGEKSSISIPKTVQTSYIQAAGFLDKQ